MAGSISRTYEDASARAVYAIAVDLSPATALLQGRGYSLDTAGGIFAQQMAVLVLTFFLLYAAWSGVRLTRTLEDKGYFDVISSGTVGRLAPTGAGLLSALCACVLTGLGVGLVSAMHGFGTVGAARYGLIVALLMIVCATLGTMCAQLFRHSAEALYLAVILIVVGYLVRGWLDYEDSAATWVNPANWLAEARPFDDVAVTLVSPLIALLALGSLSGVGLWLSVDEPGRYFLAVASSLAYYPAVAVCGALAILLAAIRPGLNMVLWLVVVWAIIVTLPSDALDLSTAVRHASPIEWLGQVPHEPVNVVAAMMMIAIAVVAIALGGFRFGRRDLVGG